MRKRTSTEQSYEPLVTPESWKGDELRFSVRLTQILDGLFARLRAMRTELAGKLGKTEQAADSAKLGGKAPEYYLTPVNLLVNSDFSNPLNTNGYVSGTQGSAKACIDGWLLQYGTSLSIGSGLVRLSGLYSVWQNVSHTLKAGVTYTLAARLRASGGSRTVWVYAEDTNGKRYTTPTNENSGEWVTLVGSFTPASNVGNMQIHLTNSGDDSAATDVAWVTLYEGTYTAETLPPCVPTHPRVESLKLGNPVQPVNLLDNSNLLDPVNQRGYTNGTTVENTKFIDRWSVSGASSFSLGANGMEIKSGFCHQIVSISKIKSGHAYTLACKMNGNILCYNGVAEETIGAWEEGLVTIYYAGQGVTVYLTKAGVPYEWVALYEGAYTAETLPPYVPKGYAVELAECQRYYQEIPVDVSGSHFATVSDYPTRIPVIYPTQMRMIPDAKLVESWNSAVQNVFVTYVTESGLALAVVATADGNFAEWHGKITCNADL